MSRPVQKRVLAASVLALSLVGGGTGLARQAHGGVLRRGAVPVAGVLVAASACLLFRAYGPPRRDQVAAADELVAANARLERASRRFEELYQALPIPCFCYDAQGRIFEWNRALEDGFGLTPARLFQRAVWEAMGTPTETAFLKACVAAVFAGEAPDGWEQVWTLPDGQVRHWLCRAFPLRSPEGTITGGIHAYTDITERLCQEAQIAASLEQIRDYNVLLEAQKREVEAQKRLLERTNMSLEVANAALESLATQDGLTGLKNHRAFQERLELELTRARRYGQPLSLVLLDVDHFKQYNDSYGHPAGDDVLSTVARLLDQNMRETDMAARYGGEEFAVILPNTGGEGACVVAERLRAALADCTGPLRRVTASLGVSTLTPAMPDRASLIAAADQALYWAKDAGRNRVVHAADCAALTPLVPLAR